MIGTQFTITNKAHPERSITINDMSNPNKFIALQAYPTFEVDIRNDEMNKEGQHGIWDFFSFYGKRVITFEGVIIGNDESDVIEIKDLLQYVLELPAQPMIVVDDGTVIISWTDPLGREVQTEAKIYAPVRFNRNMQERYRLDFFMTLKSANPVIESQEIFENSGLRGYLHGGMTIPFTSPFTLPHQFVNILEVNNLGNTISDITVRMYGGSHFPINNPTITNLTTGMFMKINYTLADETAYISINTRTGEVVNQNGDDLSGLIEAGSSFPRLNIGLNEYLYTSDESEGVLSPPVTHIDPIEVVESEHRFGVL